MKLSLYFLLFLSIVTSLFSQDTINEYCPVTPDEIIDTSITTVHDAMTVGFCCKRCLRKFTQNPQAYVDQLPVQKTPETSDHSHADDAHDHSTDHGDTPDSFFQKLLAFGGKLHVLIIHFPIAFLLLSSITQIVADFKKDKFLLKVTHLIFAIGSISAIFAGLAGWISASQSTYSGDLYLVLEIHRWVGTLVVFFSSTGLICLVWAKKPLPRILLRILILTPLVLVPLTAHFGGSLVYGTSFLKF
jgi:uncharacterized membrane protein